MTAVETTEANTKTVKIIVNGRPKKVAQRELTFDEVVELAFNPVPTGENVDITVTYRRGHGHKPQGQLRRGSGSR